MKLNQIIRVMKLTHLSEDGISRRNVLKTGLAAVFAPNSIWRAAVPAVAKSAAGLLQAWTKSGIDPDVFRDVLNDVEMALDTMRPTSRCNITTNRVTDSFERDNVPEGLERFIRPGSTFKHGKTDMVVVDIPGDLVRGFLVGEFNTDHGVIEYNWLGLLADTYADVFKQALAAQVKKEGVGNIIRHFFADLSESWSGGMSEIPDGLDLANDAAWANLYQCAEANPEIGALIDIDWDRTDNGCIRNMTNLAKRGIFHPDDVNRALKKFKAWRQRNAEVEQEREANDAQAKKNREEFERASKPEDLEDIKAPDDYKLASSMHQPFESRLNKALKLLV